MTTVLLFSIHFAYLAAGLGGLQAPQGAAPATPTSETFHLNAIATPAKGSGTVTVPVTIRIERYTREHSRVTMTNALKHGGYPNFVRALRAAPIAGTLTMTGRTFSIRWAHQEPREGGRTITLVTDKPIFFIGSGHEDAKSTAGYEVAVVKLELDASGGGDGIMAAAARVKPGGEGAVRIDDYAETPVKLTVAPAARK
jgi:hypothetical protein